MNNKVMAWLLLGNDTGASSKAIVAQMEGIPASPIDYPRDPADLGRCIRLMNIEPSYRARIHEMSTVGDKWKALVDHWAELEALYHAEKDTELFDRMFELINGKPYPRAELEAFLAWEATKERLCPGCQETQLKEDEAGWWCDQCREHWSNEQLAEHQR